mmetsp:Transcript_25698/g.83321  ORF Transcript_25698/g.83321 Transcript_25698/m.83321 type:complete len:116 (-) Transcript_25698:479-826(-)
MQRLLAFGRRRNVGRRFAFVPPQPRMWRVYLSGEIHSGWRSEITAAVEGLPIVFTSPNPSHEDSDDCGAVILGDEASRPNYDNKGARLNLIRTKTAIHDADVVVVRFGEKYVRRQ